MRLADVHADCGRPDTRELSRLIAVLLLERTGCEGVGSTEFSPTGTVTRTPATPGELVPGDPVALSQAAVNLQEWARTAPADIAPLITATADAHAGLGDNLLRLREAAEQAFTDAAEAGIPADCVCNSSNFAAFVETNPDSLDLASSIAERAATLRIDWLDAQQRFIDALSAPRREFGIADW